MRCRLLMLLPVLGLAADGPAPAAKAYLDAAIQIMQEHFLYKDRVDWAQLKTEALAAAGNAQTPVETYAAIRVALAKLGDHHSYLQLTPELMRQEGASGIQASGPASGPSRNPLPSPFRTRRVPEGAMVAGAAKPIAQLVIPMFSGPDLDGFATRIQEVIAQLTAKNPCGWIVDVRGNGGGNIWPMLAGVGPLLGDGEPFGILTAAGKKEMRYYERGQAGVRADQERPYYVRTMVEPVRLKDTPPVAVLIDRETGSSGEGIAIAFRGRAQTRFFGETTFGAAKSTFPFKLSDGAQIYLVTGVMVDRNGNEYLTGVQPDEEILSEFSIASHDPVIGRAAEWLAGREACRAR